MNWASLHPYNHTLDRDSAERDTVVAPHFSLAVVRDKRSKTHSRIQPRFLGIQDRSSSCSPSSPRGLRRVVSLGALSKQTQLEPWLHFYRLQLQPGEHHAHILREHLLWCEPKAFHWYLAAILTNEPAKFGADKPG